MKTPLTLFHGSPRIVREPVFGAGNPRNDYGLGFYCTERTELAAEWACTEGRDGFVNIYHLDPEGLEVLRLLEPEYHVLNWLAVLLENRIFTLAPGLPQESKAFVLKRFLPDYRGYDIMVGYRADDSYFAFANAFLNGTISLEQLRQAMRLGELGEQVVVRSERAFESLLFGGILPVPYEEFYPRRMARDRNAREAFRLEKERTDVREGVYILDLIRGNWRNDDARLR